ncbi:MAG: DUF4340 domain-containing protein [Bacteroidota bacterium]|nr:DUF4340 domain-containing protein [Bacteroidota bacterium]
MLKKYWIYIFISLISIAILWLIKADTKSSIIKDNKFAIEEIFSITKIFLADRNGNTITLTQHLDSIVDPRGCVEWKETWIVNNQFIVRKDAITTLLSTANKIRIKKPVSNTAFENVVKYMATTGVLIEFFANDKMVKSYTIGSNTPDHLGTYMLLKGRKKPFVVHIPSFNGFLSPRYGIQGNSLDVTNWRSTTVFNLSLEAINHIKYTDYLDPEKSYFLKTNPFKLISSNHKSVLFNNKKVLKLLNSFENLNCETFKKQKHNIEFLTQLEELVVNSDTLRTYQISEAVIKTKEDNFTVARKYATLNNGDLMLIQDYVFNKVLINITELIE